MTHDKITIGYDAKRIVRNATGLGNYCRTLVNNLLAVDDGSLRLRLYAPDEGRDDLRQQIRADERTTFVLPKRGGGRLWRDYWRFTGMVADLKSDGSDLYHGLSGELPRGIGRTGIPAVVTIHDLIFLRHPEYYNPIDVLIYRLKFLLTCREASHIVAISECTKRDIVHYGHVPEEKITVIYQDCDDSFKRTPQSAKLLEVAARYHLPQRFVLNVGSIEERKNVLLAVKAMQQLPSDVHLVIVGKHTAYTDEVMSYAESHGLAARVHILHGVPFADLPSIYRLAELFVYPSRYEGFGIPIIEAIYSGLPVVACTGSCLEEAGGPDSLYVAPDDVDGMARALLALLNDAHRSDRIGRSRQYVQRFDTQRVTQQMINLYRRLAQG